MSLPWPGKNFPTTGVNCPPTDGSWTMVNWRFECPSHSSVLKDPVPYQTMSSIPSPLKSPATGLTTGVPPEVVDFGNASTENVVPELKYQTCWLLAVLHQRMSDRESPSKSPTTGTVPSGWAGVMSGTHR